MTDVKFKHDIGVFSNALVLKKLNYRFSEDGGDNTVTFDLSEIKQDMLLHSAFVKVKKAATSGGAATLTMGTTSDPNAIVDAVALGSLTLDAVLKGLSTSEQIRIPKGDKITMDIGTADLTEGEFELNLVMSAY